MAEKIRWVRVQLPESVHARVRQVKARRTTTWDRIVQEGVELWMKREEEASRTRCEPDEPE